MFVKVGSVSVNNDYCDDCGQPMWLCVCISTYIEKHINEQHDYSYANDERDYDICLYCDCRRYVGSDDWVVA